MPESLQQMPFRAHLEFGRYPGRLEHGPFYRVGIGKAMNRRVLERHLRDWGGQFLRHGTRHDLWINPASRKQASVPRHKEIKIGTARNICRQLGVPEPPER